MSEYKMIVTSKHKLMDLHIKETLKYRDLIFLFVKRDFTALYKQTILGPLWAVIQPLLTTVVFTFVFGSLAGLTTADAAGEYLLPGFLFYMAGNICWNYFSGTLTKVSSTFIENRETMSKVYFPRLVTPISTALSHLIAFGIQLVMLVIFVVCYGIGGNTSIRLTPMIFLVPISIIQMMMLSVGIGIIVSSVTTKYRDMAMLVGFGLQLWQYASPVAYGLNLIPDKIFSFYLMNPMTIVITTFRYGLFGFGYFNLFYYLGSWIFTILLFFIGLVLFSRIERTFADTI